MGNQKKYGLFYERKRKKELEEQGFTVMRCRGSFGIFDIIACHKAKWVLESIKSTKSKKFYSNNDKKIIEQFNNAPLGTVKRLVVYTRGIRSIEYEGEIK